MRSSRIFSGAVIIVVVVIFGFAGQARAGFGVSPPKESNEHALPGSHFEWVVNLVKSEADKELTVTVIRDKSELNRWVKVAEGESLVFGKGLNQMPIHLVVDVPSTTPDGFYKMNMTFSSLPAGELPKGQVSLVVAIKFIGDIKVSQEKFIDFDVKSSSILPSEIGQPISIRAQIENLSNIVAAPTQINFAVSDSRYRLISSEKLDDLDGLAPFSMAEREAVAKVNLSPGQYWGELTFYNGDKVIGQDKLKFTVYPTWGLSQNPFLRRCSILFLVPVKAYLFGAVSLAALVALTMLVMKRKGKNSLI